MTNLVSVQIPCAYCDIQHTVELTQEQCEEFDGFHACSACEDEYEAQLDKWASDHVAMVTKDW